MTSKLGNIAIYTAVVVVSLYILYPLYLLFLIAFTPGKYTVKRCTQARYQLPSHWEIYRLH